MIADLKNASCEQARPMHPVVEQLPIASASPVDQAQTDTTQRQQVLALLQTHRR